MAKATHYATLSSFAIALVVGLSVVLATVGPTKQAVAATAEIDLDAVFRAVARYRYGDERKPLHALEQLVRQASSLGGGGSLRRRLADRMASLLSSKEATPAAKAFLCGQLAAIGTEQQVPALVALLADKDLAQPALSALAQIPGPAVDRILRDALENLKGDLRIGAVNALGQRRDRAAIRSLATMLADADETLACAAASALGKIGTDTALAELQTALARPKGRLRTEVAYACLTCADQLVAEKKGALAAAVYSQLAGPGERPEVRMAALRGAVLSNPEKAARIVCEALLSGNSALENMALQLVSQIPGSASTEQFAKCLGKASLPVQALLVGALAVRQDAAARAAVEAAVSSQDQTVRLAALKALGTCGNGSSVKILLDRTMVGAATPEGEAAPEPCPIARQRRKRDPRRRDPATRCPR
jgi:HEAT repeat protein